MEFAAARYDASQPLPDRHAILHAVSRDLTPDHPLDRTLDHTLDHTDIAAAPAAKA